jgi:hypothetical protein
MWHERAVLCLHDEVVPPGPKAMRKAEAIRDRLLHEVAEKQNPRTSATVDQLLDRYLDQFDGAPNTLTLRPVVDAVSYLARAAGDRGGRPGAWG